MAYTWPLTQITDGALLSSNIMNQLKEAVRDECLRR